MKILTIHDVRKEYLNLNLVDYRLTFDDGLFSQYYYFQLFKDHTPNTAIGQQRPILRARCCLLKVEAAVKKIPIEARVSTDGCPQIRGFHLR